MADAATTQLVNQIVQEFVQARRMFTAFDVTTEARRRNARRHNDVKDVVHDCFQQGRMGAAYNRSTIDVGGRSNRFCIIIFQMTQIRISHRDQETPPRHQPAQRIREPLAGSSNALSLASLVMARLRLPPEQGRADNHLERPVRRIGLSATWFSSGARTAKKVNHAGIGCGSVLTHLTRRLDQGREGHSIVERYLVGPP